MTDVTTGTMTAVRRHAYGDTDALQLESTAVPTPAADELLVRVVASSVNPADRYHLLGTPRLIQLTDGWGRPKHAGLGVDVAGEVVAVGASVTGFAVGDRVYGGSGNGWAELATLPVSRAAHVPDGVALEDAGLLPVAGITALQGLDRAGLEAGERVLVNGASGGVGHLAVQLAKDRGAHVTAVTSTRNLDLVRAFGADEVIDHTRTDYPTTGERWDVLFDTQGNHAPSQNLSVLSPGGRWVVVSGPMTSAWTGPMAYIVRAGLRAAFSSGRMVQFTAAERADDLARLIALVAEGAVTPHVEATFPLADAAAAVEHLATGRTRGKLRIAVA